MSWSPPFHDLAVELRDTLSRDEWRVPIELIARRHGLESGELTPFSTGSDIVWSAGEHVIKLSAPRWTAEIAAEVAGLTRVQGALEVATPAVRFTGELEGWPYLVMSRVPGRPIGELWPALDRPERKRVAAELGRLTRSLHALAGEDEAGAWPEFWKTCTTDVPERHVARGAPPELAAGIAPFLERVGELSPSAFGFLHTELLHVHVLAEERAGRVELRGLIDFADSCVGPVEYEFAAPVEFLFRGEPGVLRAFLVGYGADAASLDAARSREMLAWALCHRFGSLARMLDACSPEAPSSLEGVAATLYGLEDRARPSLTR